MEEGWDRKISKVGAACRCERGVWKQMELTVDTALILPIWHQRPALRKIAQQAWSNIWSAGIPELRAHRGRRMAYDFIQSLAMWLQAGDHWKIKTLMRGVIANINCIYCKYILLSNKKFIGLVFYYYFQFTWKKYETWRCKTTWQICQQIHASVSIWV